MCVCVCVWGSLIDVIFVYTVGNKPIPAGHTKTGAYVGENRKLDAGFGVKGFQEFVETNASEPTVQLQIIRLFLAVIGCREWNFSAVGVSRAFLTSEPLKRGTYARLPDGVEKDNVARKLLKNFMGGVPLVKTGTEQYGIS